MGLAGLLAKAVLRIGVRAIAQGRHRLTDRREHVAVGAGPALHQGVPPALAVRVAGGGGELAEGSRRIAAGAGKAPAGSSAASATGSASIGVAASSGGVPNPSASWWACGRSMKRIVAPAASPWRIATHSGENAAKGKNAQSRGRSGR